MESSINLSCQDFVEVLASKAPVPGGGGAAALVGSIGMALGNMVGSLTVGKKKYADVQEDIIALNEKAAALEARLLEFVGKDAEVFEPLSKAYGLPKETEEQQAYKAQVMAKCLEECCAVPMGIMEACCEAIDLCEEYAAKGSAIAISDAGCGVICLKSALQAASLNVFINTKSMADRAHAEELNVQANTMLDTYCAKADRIYDAVRARLN